MEVQKLLDELDDLYGWLTVIESDKQTAVDKIITPEMKADLEAIDAEFGDKCNFIQEKIDALKNKIRPLVAKHGKSITGKYIIAQYSKPSLKVHIYKLLGYAEAHPEVLNFIEEKKPVIKFVFKK